MKGTGSRGGRRQFGVLPGSKYVEPFVFHRCSYRDILKEADGI